MRSIYSHRVVLAATIMFLNMAWITEYNLAAAAPEVEEVQAKSAGDVWSEIEEETVLAEIPKGNNFDEFPPEKLSGSFMLPVFQGDQRVFSFFRTRLTNGAKEGINFGGRYNIVTIGCGTSCISYYLIDGATGRISEFVFSGEEYPALDFDFIPSSTLIKFNWETWKLVAQDNAGDREEATCHYGELAVKEDAVGLLWRGQARGRCP